MKYIKMILKKIIRVTKIGFYYFCCVFPIKKNKIIADNFNGNEFGDNTGAIVSELLKHDNIDIYWALNKKNYNKDLPIGVKKVRYGSLKYFFVLATSKVWLDNVRNPFYIKKRKKQYYIQTWHGGFGFKRIEKDCEDALPKTYIKTAKNDSKNMDLLITNSKWQKDYFSKCFYYNGKIIISGYPRNDYFFSGSNFDNIKKQVYSELEIDSDTKVLLYAPTFRDDHNIDCYNIDYDRLLKILKKKTSSNWKILIRLHPNIADMKLPDKVSKKVINVTKYPSLNNLMIASDALISDYSTLVFDYTYLSKPIVLYASDIEQYAKARGFLFRFDELPFPYATNNDELEKTILNYSSDKYMKELNAFYKRHELLEDGHASERIVKIILEKISE